MRESESSIWVGMSPRRELCLITRLESRGSVADTFTIEYYIIDYLEVVRDEYDSPVCKCVDIRYIQSNHFPSRMPVELLQGTKRPKIYQLWHRTQSD